mgnify:CR=1 FL=1
MLLKKNYVDTLVKVLEGDLKDMNTIKKPSDATKQCMGWSNELLTKLTNGDLEIDGGLLGYLDTILFNYMPSTIEMYQDLVDIQIHMMKNIKDAVYPVESMHDLIQAFTQAKNEGRGLKVYTMYDSNSAHSDIDVIHASNLDRKLKFYEDRYKECALNGDEVKINILVGYSLF